MHGGVGGLRGLSWQITNIFGNLDKYISKLEKHSLLFEIKECIFKGNKKPLNGCMAGWEDCEAYLGKLPKGVSPTPAHHKRQDHQNTPYGTETKTPKSKRLVRER